MIKHRLPIVAVVACAFTALGTDLAIEEIVVTASRIGAVDQRVVALDEEEVHGAFFHAADALRVLPGLARSTNGHRGSLTQARGPGYAAPSRITCWFCSTASR